MNFKIILLGCIVASIAVAQISAQCLCGAEGEDVCSCSATRVPRPRQLPRFQPRTRTIQQNTCSCSSSTSSQNRQQFRPIGDRCSCGNSAVTPAIRPQCSCQRNNNPSSSSSVAINAHTSDCGQTVQAPFETNVYTTNHIKKEDLSSLTPIDPVSMSLAYKAAQRATVTVPEERLAYGFKKSPINAEQVKSYPNIPEEKLYSFSNNVVELKDIPCRKHHNREEELEEEEEEEEEESDSKPNCGLGYLNYKQMGYVPEEFVEPRFAVEQFETEVDEEVPCNQEKIEDIGSCGYRAGRILNHANNEENFS